MGYQTLEALRERKLDNWLKRGIITKRQYKDIIYYCVEYGFWDALGYATRLKYKNNPYLKKKYEYKWLRIPKKECFLMEYKTTGSLSKKHRKRIRKWRNIFLTLSGENRQDKIKQQYPDWEIFFMRHRKYNIGLRRKIRQEAAIGSSPEQASKLLINRRGGEIGNRLERCRENYPQTPQPTAYKKEVK